MALISFQDWQVILTFFALGFSVIVMIYFLFRKPPRPVGDEIQAAQQASYAPGQQGVDSYGQLQPQGVQPVYGQYARQ
jgi:hypothetical protein